MRGSRAIGLVLGIASMMAIASPQAARAQEADRKALAQAIYEDAKRDMDAKRYADACRKFASSQKLDPGLGTMLNLGLCYEKTGQTASAWTTFKDAASEAARTPGAQPREQFAREHATALEPLLPHLTIAVSPDAAIDGLEVKRDGVTIPQVAWGVALPVDPGEHVVEASAPKRKAWSAKVQSVEKETATVKVPSLELAPEAPVVVPPPPTTTSATPHSEPPRTIYVVQQDTPGSGQRTWGVVAIIFGGVGIAASMVGGVIAKTKDDNSNSGNNCVNDVCNGEGMQKRQDAATFARLATYVFIGGAVFVAGGITLYATSASAKSGQAQQPPVTAVKLGVGGLSLTRTW